MTDTLVARAIAARPLQPAKPTAAGTAVRASAAGSCLRQMTWNVAAHLDPDQAVEQASSLAMDVGTALHTSIQEGLVQLGYDVEVPVDWSPDYPVSGHADAVGSVDGTRQLVELKTTGALSYVRAAPKPEHVLQAGIYACSPQIQADQIVIAYIDRSRFAVVEHTLETDDVRDDVTTELCRMSLAAFLADVGHPRPPRVVARGMEPVVLDPTDRGDWQCRFCAWRDRCVEVGP